MTNSTESRRLAPETNACLKYLSNTDWSRLCLDVCERPPKSLTKRIDMITLNRACVLHGTGHTWVYPSVQDFSFRSEAHTLSITNRQHGDVPTQSFDLPAKFLMTSKRVQIHSVNGQWKSRSDSKRTIDFSYDNAVSFETNVGTVVFAAHDIWPMQLHFWFLRFGNSVTEALAASNFSARSLPAAPG